MPDRLSRTRKLGSTLPAGTVYVGRPTCWGNPFSSQVVEDAAGEYRRWLLDPSRTDHLAEKRRIIRTVRQLMGKNLSCWCPPGAPCHADTLLDLANRPRNVMQTTKTNCFAACVATLLDVPIETVPAACDGATWDFDAFQRWLAEEHSMQAIEIVLGPASLVTVQHPVPCILTGDSPRQCLSGQHAIVGEFSSAAFTMSHDPHASRDGIVGDAKYVTFFVKIAAASL